MITIRCSHCGGEMQAPEGMRPRACPYCQTPFPAESSGPSPLDERIAGEKNPKKKYKLIQEALTASPDDFAANRALLFHGRLHEPMRGHAVDFSIVKCHLLSVFETPATHTVAQIDAKIEELLRAPQLLKTMALAPDPDAFFEEYLLTLATSYIDLFIRGDSRNSRLAFGFPRSSASLVTKCREPVEQMLRAVETESRLSDDERQKIRRALRQGFVRVFGGQGAPLEG